MYCRDLKSDLLAQLLQNLDRARAVFTQRKVRADNKMAHIKLPV